MFRSLLRQGISRLPAAAFRRSSTACEESNVAPPLSQNELPRRRNRELKPFNQSAIMDLLVGKFDDDLLLLPEVLSDEEWMALAERGIAVENALKSIKYDKILSTDKVDDAARKKLCELGIFRHCIPTEYGGYDYTETERMYLHETIGQYPSLARILGENEDWGIKAISVYGTEEQKQKYLPRLASGESMIAMAYMEPSGNVFDPSSYLKTAVTESDSGILLNGKKTWVKNANLADMLLVLASHSVAGKDGEFVLNSFYLLDKNSDGVVVLNPKKKSWLRGFDICDVIFDEVRVAPENVVGGYGKGLDVLRELYKTNKFNILAECSATMKKLIHDAIAKCKQAKFLTDSLESRQFASVGLAELSSLLYAMESVTYYLPSKADYYLNPDLGVECLLGRLFATETLPEAVQIYFNVLGREGYKKNSFVEEVAYNAHFYSVLDEPNHNLKIFLLEECIPHVANKLATVVKQSALKLDYPKENQKMLIPKMLDNDDKPTHNLQLELCVPNELCSCARDLEYCILRLAFAVERHLQIHQNEVMEHDYEFILICDIFIQVYALLATLARAARATTLKLTNHGEDIWLAKSFAAMAANKVKHLSNILGRSGIEVVHKQNVGKRALNEKTYLAEHPLMRNF